MINAEKVSKTYRNAHRTVEALKEVSFSIGEGSFTVITGASGSGKSTLLFVLGGLIRPTSGTVRFRGTEIYGGDGQSLADYRNKSVGFVLQKFNLIPYLSARENVMVPMIPRVGRPGSMESRADSLLDRIGLGERKDFLPRELSVGQQQRVAIARALANDPELILADEPTGNLDPGLSDEIIALFSALNREDGRTIVMVTHNPATARHGTQSFVLEDGICRETQTR